MASTVRRNWSRDELIVLISIFHNQPFSIGDDARPECTAMAECFGRQPSAIDRQWRNIADVRKGKHSLQITKLIPELLLEYLEDPLGHDELARAICRQNDWPIGTLIDEKSGD